MTLASMNLPALPRAFPLEGAKPPRAGADWERVNGPSEAAQFFGRIGLELLPHRPAVPLAAVDLVARELHSLQEGDDGVYLMVGQAQPAWGKHSQPHGSG